jgi:hypothetical protein
METLLKYKAIDLGIYSKDDIRKAQKYTPVYKRLSNHSLEGLAKAYNGLGMNFKTVSDEITKWGK